MTTRAETLRALLFASSAAGMLMAGPALAGDPDPTDPQSKTYLGAIVVTGQPPRREPRSPEFVAPLVDTPRAVTIIPQQIIEQTGATSLQDILRNSPGITLGAGEGGQPLADRPVIRGQTSGNNIFVDGIRDTGGQQREVFDLEQVEIIKGADSVYSGRGSGGGSINLTSKTPKLTDFTALSLGGGADGYLRATIDQNWTLGETAAFRLNLLGAEGDVARRNAVDYDRWGLALSLAAGLGTDTSITAGYYHLDANQMPDYGVPLFTKTGVRTTASGILDVPYDRFYGLTARDHLNTTADSFTVSVQHRLGDALSIRSVTRYAETLNDYIVTNPGDGGPAQRVAGEWWMKRGTKTRWNPATTWATVTDLSGALRTGGLDHRFDVGAEYSHERNLNAAYSTFTTSGAPCPTGFVIAANTLAALGADDCTRVFDPSPGDPWTGVVNRGPASRSTTEAVGVYAFDSVSLTDRLMLNLGLRWDRYSAAGVNVASTQAAGVFTTTATTVVPRRSWAFVNAQIGLVYKPTEQTSVYASYATASTPPTLSGGDQNTAGGTGAGNLAATVLDPEDTVSYELGAKASLFHDRLSLSAAAFHLTRNNAAIQVDVGVYEQAGEVRVEGVELSVAGDITDRWQVFGGYTYMDSELVRGAVVLVGAPPVALPNPANGSPLANTPRHSASLFSTWRALPAISIGGGVYFVSDSFGGNQGGAGGGVNRVFAPAWTRVDLFASWDLTDTASLQLNVQNAGDADYILRTNGVHHADPAPGRSATLALNLRF